METQETIGSVAWLRLLREAANEVIKEAVDLNRVKGLDTPFQNEAINWDDISCTQAKWYRDADGSEGPVIELSEAGPGGAFFFSQWICERLDERGFQDVVAITEW